MNKEELSVIQTIVENHMSSVNWFQNEITKLEDKISHIRDPHDPMKEFLAEKSETNRQKMVIHRKIVSELAPLIGTKPVWGNVGNKIVRDSILI